MVLLYPKLAPEAATRKLFGPGVIVIAAAKPVRESRSSNGIFDHQRVCHCSPSGHQAPLVFKADTRKKLSVVT